jgi:hypothetical protein
LGWPPHLERATVAEHRIDENTGRGIGQDGISLPLLQVVVPVDLRPLKYVTTIQVRGRRPVRQDHAGRPLLDLADQCAQTIVIEESLLSAVPVQPQSGHRKKET